MNFRLLYNVLGRILLIEAGLLVLPLVTALLYGESAVPFLLTILIVLAASAALILLGWKPDGVMQTREGFASVALGWIVMGLFGALPFVFSGAIPNYIDALFETVSGFTTTGSSILPEVENLPRGILFWRSFTHFIGGMGVLVFMMAVMPMDESHSMHLLRAEVPGPIKGKLVPRMRQTARILYLIYIGMTLLEFVLLLCGGLSVFDALLTAFGTTATGGFGIRNASIAGFGSVYVEMVVAAFMFLAGINFNLFYMVLLKRSIKGFKSEELLWYAVIVVFATVTIAANIFAQYGSVLTSLRYAFFQVCSIVTSTGYGTADFDLWPSYSRSLIVLLMIVGACAGSTGGGTKVARLMIMVKSSRGELHRQLFPRSTARHTLDGERLEPAVIRNTLAFYSLYALIVMAACLLLSIQGLDFETTFTSVISCMSNIGPGLHLVGPTANYSVWSGPAKLLLTLCMLLGRLEIFPVALLFAPGTWVARHK